MSDTLMVWVAVLLAMVGLWVIAEWHVRRAATAKTRDLRLSIAERAAYRALLVDILNSSDDRAMGLEEIQRECCATMLRVWRRDHE